MRVCWMGDSCKEQQNPKIDKHSLSVTRLGLSQWLQLSFAERLGHMQMIEEIECPTRAIEGHASTCQILNNGAMALGATAAGFGAPFCFRPYQEV